MNWKDYKHNIKIALDASIAKGKVKDFERYLDTRYSKTKWITVRPDGHNKIEVGGSEIEKELLWEVASDSDEYNPNQINRMFVRYCDKRDYPVLIGDRDHFYAVCPCKQIQPTLEVEMAWRLFSKFEQEVKA